MEPELILRFAAIVIASLLLFANIDLSSLFSKVISIFKRNPTKPIVSNNSDHTEIDFLKVLGLWYQLKNNCESYGLKLAAEKLDEVFPLLNNEEKKS